MPSCAASHTLIVSGPCSVLTRKTLVVSYSSCPHTVRTAYTRDRKQTSKPTEVQQKRVKGCEKHPWCYEETHLKFEVVCACAADVSSTLSLSLFLSVSCVLWFTLYTVRRVFMGARSCGLDARLYAPAPRYPTRIVEIFNVSPLYLKLQNLRLGLPENIQAHFQFPEISHAQCDYLNFISQACSILLP